MQNRNPDYTCIDTQLRDVVLLLGFPLQSDISPSLVRKLSQTTVFLEEIALVHVLYAVVSKKQRQWL